MKQAIKEILKFAIGGFFLLLAFSVRWGLKNWDSLSYEEVLYQLNHLEGTGGGMIERYLQEAAVPAIILFLVVLVVYLYFIKSKKAYRKFSMTMLGIFLVVGLSAFLYFGIRLGVMQYYWGSASKSMADELENKEFIEYYYVDPRDVKLEFPEKKRNLVFIYLESFEMTFADTSVGGDFPVNVIPEMTEIGLQNNDFSSGGAVERRHCL